MDKRLTYNPLSYKGLRQFPKRNTDIHGNSPDKCRIGNMLVTSEDGTELVAVPCPCYACEVAMRASAEQSTTYRRKRVTGRRLVSAFFHP